MGCLISAIVRAITKSVNSNDWLFLPRLFELQTNRLEFSQVFDTMIEIESLVLLLEFMAPGVKLIEKQGCFVKPDSNEYR